MKIVVVVHGIPPKTPANKLEKLIPDLQIMVGAAEGMKDTCNNITVFLPSDLVPRSGKKIVVLIFGVKSRNMAVLKSIKERVEHKIKGFYFPDSLVEVSFFEA